MNGLLVGGAGTVGTSITPHVPGWSPRGHLLLAAATGDAHGTASLARPA